MSDERRAAYEACTPVYLVVNRYGVAAVFTDKLKARTYAAEIEPMEGETKVRDMRLNWDYRSYPTETP